MSTSDSPGSADRPGRGRRPAALVRSEVLSAAAELLYAEGIGAVTFDRVASSAGSSKTTIYKWWPTPGALAAEAYFDRVERALDFPDSGDIVADIRAQLTSFAQLMNHEDAGRAVRQLIGAAQTDPELRRAFAENYARPRREEAVRAFERAQRRGQIALTAPLAVLVDQLWGACYHRILLFDEPIDDVLIDRLVANALNDSVLFSPTP